MAKGEKKGRSLALYETILKLKDLDECCRFFDDLCTPTELRSLEQRFDVAGIYVNRYYKHIGNIYRNQWQWTLYFY